MKLALMRSAKSTASETYRSVEIAAVGLLVSNDANCASARVTTWYRYGYVTLIVKCGSHAVKLLLLLDHYVCKLLLDSHIRNARAVRDRIPPPTRIRSGSTTRIRIADPYYLQNLMRTFLSDHISVIFFHENPIDLSQDISQIVGKCLAMLKNLSKNSWIRIRNSACGRLPKFNQFLLAHRNIMW